MTECATLGPDEYVPACPEHGRWQIVRQAHGALACGCGWQPGEQVLPPETWFSTLNHNQNPNGDDHANESL